MPTQKQQAPDGKQKTLMGWLSKSSGGSSSSPSQPKVQPKKQQSTSSAKSSSSTTPGAIKRVEHVRSSSSHALPSDELLLDVNDTPPTSDPIDVDMLSDGEEEEVVKKSAKRVKRKVLSDEDSDTGVSSPTGTSVANGAPSSPLAAKGSLRGPTKKPRLSAPLLDDEDEDDENINSFTQKLSAFKKPSPKKRLSRRSSQTDDDDFIVHSGSDSDVKSKASSRSRTSKSASSAYESDSGLSDAPKKPKKKAAPARPALQKNASNTQTDGAFNFLTAAEQRAEDKKNDKKTTEDPFEFLLNPKDKDGKRPGEAGYDPRTLYVPKKAWDKFTPFEKQFWEIKQNHFDTILFFQKGKFYELYEEDARIGHQVFDLKLTQRVKMSMVGVPESSFDFWAAKFLAKGYKVGKVEQAETALGAEMRMASEKTKGKKSDSKADKIVRRELNKVYTNGTLVDPQLLTDDQAGHLVAIRENLEENTFGLCVLDSSTSEFNLSTFADDICRTKLETMMRQLRLKELLVTKGNLSVPTTRLLKAVLPSSCLWTSLRETEGFGYTETLGELKELYPTPEDEMEENAGVPEAIRGMMSNREPMEALGCMIWYLRQLNIDKDILSMQNFNVYDPMKRGQGLVLDGQTLAHVEVLVNNEGSDEGSLLKLLGRCVTPFGKRLFRIWLCVPLREITDINARLDAVQDLIDHPTFESDFNKLTKGLPDLERIVSRIHAKNCRVKEFLKVLESFKRLSKGLAELADTAESFKSHSIPGLLRGAPNLLANVKHVESCFQRPQEGSDELVPTEGKDEAYDEITKEIRRLEKSFDKELKSLESKTGLDLTYWHSAIGNKDIYLVQVSTKEKAAVPKTWTKNSGTKAVTRYLIPELAKDIRALKEARETRSMVIKEFKMRVFAEFDADRDVWLHAIKTLAELDCLFSLAKASIALGEPMCRPEFVESDAAFIDFEELRHPALCLKATDFIPNDVKLGSECGRVALLTGPNMGGKSTAMRMTAVGVIMAQLGMMVPANRARLSPVDAILTRMGAYDNMFSHASTFKVELDECCKILRDATPKSLVIMDELGRGTSTYDGMAIAGAVLHQLATHTLALTFFATHYGALTDDFAYHPNIRNMHMSTQVDDEKHELVFLYKLVEGIASSSFGTHVANLAGVPMEVVKRADLVSKDFAQKFKDKIEGQRITTIPIAAQADFAYLVSLAKQKVSLPGDPSRKKDILNILKASVNRYLPAVA